MCDTFKLGQADIETPALLVDLDVMERNLETMARFFCNRPAKLRPHFKNHRVLELAARHMERGAIGITCARLWQAERLAGFGIRDILIANEIAGETPIERFVELSREVSVLVAVDNSSVVADIATRAQSQDGGQCSRGRGPWTQALRNATRRTGRGAREDGGGVQSEVQRPDGIRGPPAAFAAGAEKERAVTEAMQALAHTRKLIESAGIPVGIVSCGGTGDYSIAGAHAVVTENQAGSYLLMDTWCAPFAPDFNVALSVLATVISKTAGERLVVDAGCKAISGERGLPSVKGTTGLKLKALHAEHAPIAIEARDVEVDVGDKIEIVVQYHDGTINLHKRMYGVRNGAVERIFSIEQ